MEKLQYRKLEQSEIHKMLDLVSICKTFHIGNEEKIIRNWNNIETIGGFHGEKLVALLTTDPYNPVRWYTEKKSFQSFATKKNAFLMEPFIHPEYFNYNESIIMDLMEAYFDSLTFCDEMILYTTAEIGDTERRDMLKNLGFQVDNKLPKKWGLKAPWSFFSERKKNKILNGMKLFLEKAGLPWTEIDDTLIYTELLGMVIYILVETSNKDYSTIRFFGYIATLPEISEELVKMLLKLNFDSGTFCVDSDWNVLVTKSKLGPFINDKDIELSIKSIAMAMSRYGDIILSKSGGENLFDCILIKKPLVPLNYRYLLEEI